MTEPLADFDTFIYDEMMVHPVLFTHAKASKVALIHGKNRGIAQEILKHPHVTELCLINSACQTDGAEKDSRLQWQQGDTSAWLENIHPESFDVIIIADTAGLPAFTQATYQQYRRALAKDGILVCPSDSLFQLNGLKSSYQAMQEAGFEDLHVLHFPQPSFPSGSRAAIMASNKGAFKRIREKDIFNKPFATRYYNYDVHHAALVMPEFMRQELTLEQA
jgi:spermidine synthase